MSAWARLPGLDGLRGVAVLAVIGYHLDLGPVMPAGFLGVDIFFTVSGFIITALLLQEHAQTGRIDFRAFYLRRARRLFPAALVMLLVLVPLTALWQPSALARLREDLPAALLYLSNWWQIVAQQSYFEAIEQPRLLQHLWSLAVEEQYYLLWPLVALGLLQRTGRLGLGVAAGLIALASTAWMAWLFTTQLEGGDPSRVYLGTDTHGMGLLAGSALAAWWNPWAMRGASAARDTALNLVGTAALAALVGAMAVAHEGMPGLYQGGFLGVAGLTCAVLGAATQEGTWVAWLLSTRPLQWLGARSYSLYLWHWPVVVMVRPSAQADALELTGVTALRLLLTWLCAEASYRWVENRWRHGAQAHAWHRNEVMAAAAGVLICAGVLGFMPGHTREGLGAAQSLATGSVMGAAPNANGRYQKVTLVGDSVLLGAGPYLLRHLPAASVEAKVGRQGSDGLKLVQSLRQAEQLGDAAVIHLGTNGYLSEKQFRALLEQLADRQTVVVLNVYGARRWTGPNNELIARVSRAFGNVQLVDWQAMGRANPDFFVQDGIHLSGTGIRAYYNQIRIALGQPEVMNTRAALRPSQGPQKPQASGLWAPAKPPQPSGLSVSSPDLLPAPLPAPSPAPLPHAEPVQPGTPETLPAGRGPQADSAALDAPAVPSPGSGG